MIRAQADYGTGGPTRPLSAGSVGPECGREWIATSHDDGGRPTYAADMQGTRVDLREGVRHIIFDHDTPESRAFDVGLLALIALSVLLVML